MATNKRHFEWFTCEIGITCRLAGHTRTLYSFFDFFCAFSLCALQACVNINYFLPKRFCDAKLTFRMIEPVLSRDFSNGYLHMRSYDAIKQMAIRNIIYTLTIEKLIYEFQVDKTL